MLTAGREGETLSPMQMPGPAAEIQKLTQLFAGTWTGEEKLHPSEWDPKGGPAFGTWHVHASLDGHFLLVDYLEERDGKLVYRGHGVNGWDAKQGCFLEYWFDNLGFPPGKPNRATLEGDVYRYESDDGERGRSRFTYRFEAGTLAFSIERSRDGVDWKPMHEGRYQRR